MRERKPEARSQNGEGSFWLLAPGFLSPRISLPLYGHAVDFDPIDARPTALSVAAAGHKVGESDFVNFAEVGVVDPLAVVVSAAISHF